MTFLGNRLKKRRRDIGLTLSQLADATRLTPSFISQVERGVTMPSLNSIQRIADALNVQMAYFMAEDTRAGIHVTRANQRRQINVKEIGTAYELLTPDISGSYEMLAVHLQPGAENAVRRLRSETDEVYYVVDGEIKITLEGEEIILKKGDSLQLFGSSLKAITCYGNLPADYLVVISPPVL